jgi:hypothetical protein
MRQRFRPAAIAVLLVLGLSACANMQRTTTEKAPDDLVDTTVYIAGADFQALGTARLREILSEIEGIDLTTAAGRREIDDLLIRLRAGEVKAAEEAPAALRGLAGLELREQLEIAIAPADAQLSKDFAGKIRDYLFNENTGAGYLEVETWVTTRVQGTPVQVDRYYWWIAVGAGGGKGFTVHEREDSQPDNPFPGTINLPPAAKDFDNPDGIWQRGLDHKLFARGETISVLAVTRNGQLLPPADPVYQTSADSCIDLLLRGYPPRDTLPQQRAYCLGRCAHPMILNTGV